MLKLRFILFCLTIFFQTYTFALEDKEKVLILNGYILQKVNEIISYDLNYLDEDKGKLVLDIRGCLNREVNDEVIECLEQNQKNIETIIEARKNKYIDTFLLIYSSTIFLKSGIYNLLFKKDDDNYSNFEFLKNAIAFKEIYDFLSNTKKLYINTEDDKNLLTKVKNFFKESTPKIKFSILIKSINSRYNNISEADDYDIRKAKDYYANTKKLFLIK